jgi:ABC-type transport system involved in multi-copper enzyme maturation permease subunit
MLAAAALLLFTFVLRALLPKVSAVAMTTSKEVFSQPLIYVIMVMGSFILVALAYVPYFTFGEDVKMVKDSGLTLIMLAAIMLALWTASVSISDEIEGRTALTLLSKPISRVQFIVGKFFGVLIPVGWVFIVLGVAFLEVILYKVVYDARESGVLDVSLAAQMAESVHVVPGLVLAFFEATVFTAISVAISTRLPMLPNMIICFAIYVVGHLAPMLVDVSWGEFEIIGFVAKLIATVLPNLDSFNVYAAVATGVPVPLTYLGLAFVYCLLYSTMVLFAALISFEDRDLA